MNFYPIDFEEQASQQLICEPLIDQTNQSQYYEYDQSAQQEPEQLNTFDGYLQEEPVLLFNYVEEAPKKKTKHIIVFSKHLFEKSISSKVIHKQQKYSIFKYYENFHNNHQINNKRKSKKIKKVDSETDVPSGKRLKSRITNNDVLKLQQCQRLKTIISQMEALLQQTRTSILNQYMKNHTK